MKTLLLISLAFNLLVAEQAWSYKESSQKLYGIETSDFFSRAARYKVYSLANGNREFIGFIDKQNRCTYAYGYQFPLLIVLVEFGDQPGELVSKVVEEPSHIELHYLLFLEGSFWIDEEDDNPCPDEDTLKIWGQN